MENQVILDIYRIGTPALLALCGFFLLRIIKKVDWLGVFINELNVNLQKVNVLCPEKHREIDKKFNEHDEKLDRHEMKINELETRTAVQGRNILTLQGKQKSHEHREA